MLKRCGLLLAGALFVVAGSSDAVLHSAAFQTNSLPAQISDEEFWKLFRSLSEPDGSYQYENYVSNEITSQRVIPALRKLTQPNGVYIGVGPEQNFTYAGALRSKIAFVIDIRRQNALQLFLYKALFDLSLDRADFISKLFSRKRPTGLDESATAAILFTAYAQVPADASLQSQTFEAVKTNFSAQGFIFSEADIATMEKIHGVFLRGGPSIEYGFESQAPPMAIGSPSYARLMNSSDTDCGYPCIQSYGPQAAPGGQNWSYLASEDNFRYIREMHRRNLFIPVVGNFAGPSAIRNIAAYLRTHNATLTAFYVSNVEQYLSEPELQAFYTNVGTLPIDESSMFIRFVHGGVLSVTPWWTPAIGNTSVVSPVRDLAIRADPSRPVTYLELLRRVEDPVVLGGGAGTIASGKDVSGRVLVEGGGAIPRFTIPVLGPGRPVASIAINPDLNGIFKVRLPIGLSQAGAPSGLPAGFAVTSILYGSTDLQQQSFNVTSSDTAELVIRLRR